MKNTDHRCGYWGTGCYTPADTKTVMEYLTVTGIWKQTRPAMHCAAHAADFRNACLASTSTTYRIASED